jgi:hypothetical protein
MAYQFADTFDHYSTSFLSTMYDAVGGSPTIGAYGRFSAIGSFPNQGISFTSSSQSIRKNLKSNQGTLITFFSYGNVSLPGSGQSVIAAWFDNGTLQLYLGINSTGSLQFYQNSAVARGPASASGLISPSTLPNHGIEAVVTFAPSGGGSVKCYLDGVLVIPLTTGLTTSASGNSYANQAGLGNFGGSGYASTQVGMYSDYFRVWDGTGSYQNAATGNDARKLTKLATGVGAYSQWTAVGQSQNWQSISQNPPNSGTDYVFSNGNNYDAYATAQAGFTVAPNMTVVKSYVEKTDSVTRAVEIGVVSNGTNGLSSPITLGSSYVFVDNCISVDPATGNPPTAAAADAFEILRYEST